MASCPICRVPHHRLGRRRVMSALVAAPRALARTLGRASRRRLARRPARGEWSVTEVLGHLLDAEVTLGFRIRKQILTHWAEHDLNHLEQIRSALRARTQRRAVRR